jgi:tripartite-type tricarboxylate transporter receptor subunit TctC
MTQGRRQFLQLAMSAVALPFLGHAAVSQESYPSRPIRLIVGFTPGTAADITGRTFANGASDLLGQQVVVEDKPGAGSSVAAEYVARAAKDGYTLFLSSLSIPPNPPPTARTWPPSKLRTSGGGSLSSNFRIKSGNDENVMSLHR